MASRIRASVRKAPSTKRKSSLTVEQHARRGEIGRQRRSRTREKMIDAALRVFARKSYDEVGIDDVLAEANVARGTFYNHFRTREELAKAVGAAIGAEINKEIAPVIATIPDVAQRMSVAFRMFIQLAVRDSARGAILVHVMPLVGGLLNPLMRRRVMAELHEGIKEGRFDIKSTTVATDMGLGSIAMCISTIISGGGARDHVNLATEMLLRSWGMDAAEAHKLAYRPLPAAR